MKFTDLRFVPLGGVGEIGVNAYLYGQDGRWLMVDLGIGFADDRLPGVDIVLPDLQFIEQQRAFLDGLVLTHAHEDHLGAVPYLWPRLGCPIALIRPSGCDARSITPQRSKRLRLRVSVVWSMASSSSRRFRLASPRRAIAARILN